MNITMKYVHYIFQTILIISTLLMIHYVNGQDNNILSTCPRGSLLLSQIGNDIVSGSGKSNDWFGERISLSDDGNVIAIGDQYNNGNGEDSGAVYVFERKNNNQWIPKGQTIFGKKGDYTSPNSLSSDGNIIAIGSPCNSDAGHWAGRVRMFQFINDKWIQMGSNINGLQSNDYFGYSLDLSDDGMILAVGADCGVVNDEGQVRVFEYNNNTQDWVQRGNTINGGQDEAKLHQVSLSQDGSTLAVGAPWYDIDSTVRDAGLVRIYQYINYDWLQLGQDLVGNNAYDNFGSSIVLSPNGKEVTIAVESYYNRQGYIATYKDQGVLWVQQGYVLRSEESHDRFGHSISCSGNGNILVVGSPYNDANGSSSGRAQVFYRQENNWVPIFSNIHGQQAYQYYGLSVAVSKDGSTIAIGGHGDSDVNGIVQVFEFDCSQAIIEL